MRPVMRLLGGPLLALPERSDLLALLIDSTGDYCLFCELPLRNDADISHRVYVSDFPYRVVVNIVEQPQIISRQVTIAGWERVILCCSACAEARGRKPAVKAWDPDYEAQLQRTSPNFGAALDAYLTRNPGAEVEKDGPAIQVYHEGAQSWIWPDTVEDRDNELNSWVAFEGDDTWRLLKYVMYEASQVRLQTERLVRLAPREANEPWATEPEFEAWVEPADGLDEAVDKRVRDTILGLNLNHYGPLSRRRVTARTDAWVSATAEFGRLEELFGRWSGDRAAASRSLFELSRSPYAGALREAIRATGCWSIWARVMLGRTELDAWSRFEPSAISAFLRSALVQYEESTKPGPDSGEDAEEEERKEGDLDEQDEEDEEETRFVMVIPGTDLTRLPRALGGQL